MNQFVRGKRQCVTVNGTNSVIFHNLAVTDMPSYVIKNQDFHLAMLLRYKQED